jgi:hypothetical protein
MVSIFVGANNFLCYCLCLSSHRHSYIGLVFSSLFLDS